MTRPPRGRGAAVNPPTRFATVELVAEAPLPERVATIFRDWLQREEPNRVTKVLGRIRAMRSGRLNDTVTGRRMRGTGPHADQLHALHRVTARRLDN